jgi:hypothetical protein
MQLNKLQWWTLLKKEVAMANKTLSEIRPGKELWNIKERVIKLWICSIWLPFCIVFDLQIINDDEKKNHNAQCKTYMGKFKLLI